MFERLSAEHTDYLDGFRGLAALIVIFGHCSNAGIDVVPMLNMSATAKIGVWLFFVLSAYLLAGKLVRELAGARGATRAIAAYSVRRLLRILPAYFVFLFAATALGSFDPGEALWHALLIEGRDHLWTIPVEMTFYALLPIVALTLSRRPPCERIWLATAVLIAATAAYAMRAPQAIPTNSIQFPAYALFFAIGILLSQGRSTLSDSVATATAVVAMIVIPLLTPRFIAFLDGSSVSDALVWSWAIGVVWGVILYALNVSCACQRLFSIPILRFYGRISFSLYLTHYYLVAAVAANVALPSIMKGAIALALATIIATGLYLAVEVPALKIGAKVARKIARRDDAIAPIAQPT